MRSALTVTDAFAYLRVVLIWKKPLSGLPKFRTPLFVPLVHYLSLTHYIFQASASVPFPPLDLSTMTTKILSIGMGGVGVISSYTLSLNESVEITSIIRSDYDVVTTQGYTISSIDYGGRRPNIQNDANITGYRPNHVCKSVGEISNGPFDYIVVSTKVIPSKASKNVWDEIEQNKAKLIKPNKQTSVVLIQNGFGIDDLWKSLAHDVVLISGVSYISSINDKGTVTQYGHDSVVFGVFDHTEDDTTLNKFIELYSNDANDAGIDQNVRFTRWKKLLYNATYNTVCCLTDQDVGKLYGLEDENIIENVIIPLMKEVQFVANQDLGLFDYGEYNKVITDDDVLLMVEDTQQSDAQINYQPSMLVDVRNGRMIELDCILASILRAYKANGGKNPRGEIPYLTFLYYMLSLVQSRIQNKE